MLRIRRFLIFFRRSIPWMLFPAFEITLILLVVYRCFHGVSSVGGYQAVRLIGLFNVRVTGVGRGRVRAEYAGGDKRLNPKIR
ncbi:MAG: hypothetical protein DRK00_08915 [Thermoprotei archaeon]|nr:MAG: hypothetical protein DRK00_08915 [Thermoprotei archaeon]